ncbi:MAG TPA: hypothetical protein VKU02_13075 [Gemmataceae bacterium]|nr:hypothetical protein [Gemmataceae bacterium]
MADKSTTLILAALTKAMSEPAGVPLHGNRGSSGLFAASALAKQAAQRCLDEGYLRVLHRQSRGRSVQDVCTISDKGLTYLLSQESPRAVLEDLVRILATHQERVAELVAATQRWQAGLESLRMAVAKVLEKIPQPALPVPLAAAGSSRNGSAAPSVDLLACLSHWQASGSSSDCPLPELFRSAQSADPSLTIGRFHDALRHLHADQKIYLHPWSGPLYEIPDPSYAVLIGHEVAYYASIR